jgi:hypothetical protein
LRTFRSLRCAVAPEIITRRVYTPAVDLWSAGVILYILLSGVVPFEDADEKKLFSKIARAAYSLSGPEFATVSSEAKRLIAGLMCLEPTRRFTARQALAHGWFERAARTSVRILVPPSASASAGSSASSAFATPQASPRDAGLPPLPPSRKLSVEEAAAEAAEEESAAQPLLSTVHGLAAYAARTKPPVRVFPAGAYLIRRGERATEVFLIRSGTCAIVLEEDEPPGAAAPGAAAAKTAGPQLGPDGSPQPSPREKLMATRGPGDFVGEVGVVMDAKGSLMLPVGGAAAEAARADMLRGHGGRGVAANAAGGVGGGAAGGAAGGLPGGGGGGAEGGAAAAEAEATSPRAPPSPSADKWCARASRPSRSHTLARVAVRVSHSRRASNATSRVMPRRMPALMARKLAKKWVGSRRTVRCAPPALCTPNTRMRWREQALVAHAHFSPAALTHAPLCAHHAACARRRR